MQEVLSSWITNSNYYLVILKLRILENCKKINKIDETDKLDNLSESDKLRELNITRETKFSTVIKYINKVLTADIFNGVKMSEDYEQEFNESVIDDGVKFCFIYILSKFGMDIGEAEKVYKGLPYHFFDTTLGNTSVNDILSKYNL